MNRERSYRRYLVICLAAICFCLCSTAEAQSLTELTDRLKSSLSSGGSGGLSPGALLLSFFLGFVSSLTPCVYPLIPITLSIFGAQGDRTRGQCFLLALTYVIGIALTYTVLGVISALTGLVFGAFLGNVWVIAALSLFLLYLALFSLDLVKLPLASRLQTRASTVGGGGHAGAFLMGAVSGLVAAPCVGPVLVVLLGFVAASGDPIQGGALLFAYSMGLGLIFLVLGTFSGLIQKLPRSGNWLFGVKFLIATALLFVMFFLLQSFVDPAALIPGPPHGPLMLGLVAALGAFAAFRGDKGWLKAICAFVLALSLLPLVFPAQDNSSAVAEASRWTDNRAAAFERATGESKIVLMDLYADWCVACKEFEAFTFPDPRVARELDRFVLLRVDFTTQNDETAELASRYEIAGLPSLLFLQADGVEIPGSRITGYLKPDEFINHIDISLKSR